jgi:glycosyltransferase involved in cell wall biosynthesis
MDEPLVSVLMMAYEVRALIEKSIQSVLQQKTSFPYELVIGEDFSTDGTRDIVFEYKNRYPEIIRVVTSDHNVGMIENFVRTMKACRGKYIAYCDGDDQWSKSYKLQKQAEYLEDNPECGLVYSNFDLFYVGSGRNIPNYNNYNGRDVPGKPELKDFFLELKPKGGTRIGVRTCTVMLRRDLCMRLVESDPFLHQSDHFLMNDTQLWAEMAAISKLHYIPESMAIYNVRDESVSWSRNKNKSLRYLVSTAEMFIYLCNKYNLPESIRKRQERTFHDASLRLAFYNKNRELADNIVSGMPSLDWKNFLYYWGMRNKYTHTLVDTIIRVKNIFRK